MGKGTTKNGNSDPYRLRTVQKWGFAGRGVSLATNVIVLGYLAQYCTSMLGINTMTVGIILLISKIFDGITDIIIGFIIERTHTRWGKARPYEFGIIGVWICTVLLFSCPDLGMTGKVLWVFSMYTFVNSIFATMLNSNDSVYIARAFRYEDDRMKIISFNGVATMVISIFVSILLPILMGTMAVSRSGWSSMILIFAVPMGIIGIMRFVFVKEINPDIVDTDDKITIKDFVAAIFSSRYIWIVGGLLVFYQLVTAIGTTVGTYYFKDYVGDISKLSTLGIVALVAVPIIALLPKLTQKLGVAGTIRMSVLIAAVGSFLKYFAGLNMGGLLAATALVTFSSGTISYLHPVMTMGIMDYTEWKTGRRIEAAFSCVASFTIKIGQGLGAYLIGLLMDLSGYVSTEEGLSVVQSDSAITMIRILYSFIPAAFLLMIAVITLFWDLDGKLPQIREELKVIRENQLKGVK